ncbi:MAG: prolyl oligopeptidase family serine peptidase [Planctomycetia bacterium]|nr:prolyl oligopeptidase family serine peptidase [Planctomycetia bacterium]
MKTSLVLFVLVWSGLCLFYSRSGKADSPQALPHPRKIDHKDDYFGTKVADPYRWMENEQDPDLKNWIQAENRITQNYLSKIPLRDQLKIELTARFNYPKYSLPFKKKDLYFFFKNSGLQNQSVLYKTKSFSGKPEVLLDPNTLSLDGTVSLANVSISKDGKYLAWSISRSGSDWQEAFVKNIESGKDLADHLKWIKFSNLSWYKDGFFYSRYDEPKAGKELSGKNEFQKIYYHKVGTDQKEDQLIFMDKKNPLRNCTAEVDFDENWLFIMENESTYGNTLLFRSLKDDQKEFKTIFPDFSAETYVVAVHEGKFYLLTDYKAPNRRLVAVDPADPAPDKWIDIIPESDVQLQGAVPTGDRLLVKFLRDAASECVFYDYQGKSLEKLALPGLGDCSLSGEKDDSEFFYAFTSFVYPAVVYRSDLKTNSKKILFDSEIDFDPENYETERVWYKSKDGTRAPLFLTWKKGMKKDGSNPTLLYGYGGFNINMVPSFSPSRTVFLDHGGILAVAVLRGGGEYGEKWHKAGTKLQKQNVFDDFIAAAEHLIKEKYTSSKKLAIHGGSNGGLLVGAALTQRPDLFKAAVPAVGVLDMLRYHQFTIGWAWAADYGTSADSKEMFDYLYAYSPLHNIRKGVDYPATLILTSDHDDRVVPAHSFKFAAALQENNSGKNPVLIRIETKAGHGRGKPLQKTIEEAADMYSFILFNLQ